MCNTQHTKPTQDQKSTKAKSHTMLPNSSKRSRLRKQLRNLRRWHYYQSRREHSSEIQRSTSADHTTCQNCCGNKYTCKNFPIIPGLNAEHETDELNSSPKFSITLLRTPHLSPYYAVFQVPLRFNKLDMKSYLKELYDVDVVHIRSYTRQPKLERKESPRPNTVGGLYRPKSQKRMTAQLVDPFVWPKEIEDLTQCVHPTLP